jgi:hypothetical protein
MLSCLLISFSNSEKDSQAIIESVIEFISSIIGASIFAFFYKKQYHLYYFAFGWDIQNRVEI